MNMDKTKEYRYQLIIDGIISDQVTEKSKLDLIKCILSMKWENMNDPFGINIKRELINYLNSDDY